MLEVSKKYKGKSCKDFYCSECPLLHVNCLIFKDYKVNFENLKFNDDVPEEIKNYVKEILKEE